MKRKIGITLVTLGLILILFAVALFLYNNFENKKAQEQSNRVMDAIIDTVDNNQTNDEIDPFDTEMKVVDIEGNDYIGYLDIPELNVTLPVMSECDYSRLRVAPCRYYGSIKTDKAGYFSEYCDGYENSIKYSDIDRIKLSDLQNVKQENVSSNVAGKIISSLNWYVACEVTADEATSLSLWDSNVTVLFSNVSSDAIPAKIERIYQETPDSSALVIFECDYMDEGLIQAREEPIEVGLGTYTGLRVSKKALYDDYVTKTIYDDNNNAHTEKEKVQGVYVLYGSEVQFKQVSILYADEDYVICDPSPDDGILFNGETISMYDQVILKGDDLYDGKVIE